MTEEVKKQRSGVQLLISRVDNMRNDIALLRSRVDVSEKAVVEVKNYIKEQLIELYSQIEAAREMMDEIISFMEELKSEDEEHERDLILEQGLEQHEYGPEQDVPELTRPEENLYMEFTEDGEYPILPEEDEGQSLSGDKDFLSEKDDDDMNSLHEEESVE